MIILFLCILGFTQGHAQRHKLGLYPTSFIFSEITAEYEFFPLTTNLGFGIQITGAVNASPEKYSGCMLAPFLKIYFSYAQLKVHSTGVTCIGFTSATPTLKKGLEVQGTV